MDTPPDQTGRTARMLRRPRWSTSSPPRRGLRIGVVLLMVAAMPLTGTIVLGANTLRTAQRTSGAASDAEHQTRRVIEKLTIERAIAAEVQLAIGHAILVATPAGRADDSALDAARARTDRALGVASGDSANERTIDLLTDSVASARQADAPADVLERYESTHLAAVEHTDRALEEMLFSITVANHRGDLLDNALGLVFIIDVDRALTQQHHAAIALLVDVRGAPGSELSRLFAERSRIATNLEALEPMLDLMSALVAATGGVDPQLLFRVLQSEVDQLIDSLLAEPLLASPPAPADADGPTALAVEALTSATSEAAIGTGTLLAWISAAIVDEAGEVRSRADRAATMSSAFAIALVIATLVAAWVATRFIVRPLKRLEQAADELRDGRASSAVEEPSAPRGPAEIRAATGAIEVASRHLGLVAQQAMSLADGELDAEILDHTDPSGLGEALRLAVNTLREALVEQEQLRHQLAHEASHDSLTGLANRSESLARLRSAVSRARRTDGRIAVLFIDVDRFKSINDTYGHRVGDIVLQATATRLGATVRSGDHVGRIGGDEFVVVAEPVRGVDEAEHLAVRLLEVCSEPVVVDQLPIEVGISIGLALSGEHDRSGHADLTYRTSPDAPDDDEPEELLNEADVALYRAKEAGRGRISM